MQPQEVHSARESKKGNAIEDVRRVLMAGPTEIVVVRHGFSEANAAQKLRKKSPDAPEVQRMNEVPDREVRLAAPLGVEQAKSVGSWMRQDLGFMPDVAYVSDFARAWETAGLLGQELGYLGEWRQDPLIGERSWGRMHRLSPEQQRIEMELRDEQVREWTPAHGESLKMVSAFARNFMNSIWRKHPGEKILIVTHGEFILALRDVMEKFTPEKVQQWALTGFPNCGLLHYTRRLNEAGSELSRSFDRFRMVCPWDPNWKGGDWSGTWQNVERKTFRNEDLLFEASKFPRKLGGDR